MMPNFTLAMTEQQHRSIQKHLFPGDGLEASAILICGRSGRQERRLSVRSILLVPHEQCSVRTEVSISWPGSWIEQAIDIAEMHSFSVILAHSHPGGFFGFSSTDDKSDKLTMPALFSALPSAPHGSATMTPDGDLCARIFLSQEAKPVACKTTCIGTSIRELTPNGWQHSMPFTREMTNKIEKMTACVVGVSGTGGVVAEMLARLGIGRLILVDHDHVEHKNLNRIPHSTPAHANTKTLKVKMIAEAIKTYRENIEVIEVPEQINAVDAIRAASGADILFSCVDSIEGRLYCDLIAQAAIIPLIDMGVVIPTRKEANGSRKIGDICGRIDYVHPHGSSLQDRGVVTPEALYREDLFRHSPSDALRQLKEGYIQGVMEEAPSVVHVNTRAASDAVNEWLSRLFPLRHEYNSEYARTQFSLAAMETDFCAEQDFSVGRKPLLGQGLARPFLGLPSTEQIPEQPA